MSSSSNDDSERRDDLRESVLRKVVPIDIGAEPESDNKENILEVSEPKSVASLEIGAEPVSESRLGRLKQLSQPQSSGRLPKMIERNSEACGFKLDMFSTLTWKLWR